MSIYHADFSDSYRGVTFDHRNFTPQADVNDPNTDVEFGRLVTLAASTTYDYPSTRYESGDDVLTWELAPAFPFLGFFWNGDPVAQNYLPTGNTHYFLDEDYNWFRFEGPFASGYPDWRDFISDFYADFDDITPDALAFVDAENEFYYQLEETLVTEMELGDQGGRLGAFFLDAPVEAYLLVYDQEDYFVAPGIDVTGSAFDDVIFGSIGDDSLIGGTGDDTFNGSEGDDSIDGGSGYDHVEYGIDFAEATVSQFANRVTVSSASGTDILTDVEMLVFNDRELFVGSLGATPQNDILVLTEGDDTLDALAGDDSIEGRGGNDRLIGSAGNDTLLGEDGNDTLRGDGGNDVLLGGAGDDSFEDGDGNDSISGGSGDDVWFSNTGEDTFDGGEGRDRFVIDLTERTPQEFAIETNLATGDSGAVGLPNGRDVLLNVEDYSFFGDFNVMVTGSVADNTLQTDLGSDTLAGVDGNDRLSSGGGDDTASGGFGDDTLEGGDGNDLLRGNAGEDALFGGAGNDQLRGQKNGDLLDGGAGNDNLKGGSGNDTLLGGLGDDFLNGGTRQDSLEGGDGNDVLIGRSFDDTLIGGAGHDRLIAGGDDDVLEGGSGDDFLKGGAGADVFVFDLGFDADRLVDFDLSEDRLEMSSALADGRSADQLAALAQRDGSELRLDFGEGDVLRLIGLSEASGLAGQIDIV